MRTRVFAGLFVALLAVALFALRTISQPAAKLASSVMATAPRVESEPQRLEPKLPASPSTAPMATPAPVDAKVDPRTVGSPLSAELNARESTGARDVQVLHEMLRQYLRLLHHRQGLPIGNDTDLLRALTGHNPMHLTVLPADHPSVGADGRLRDRWGTPYFIHPRGDGAYEIRSAGPDRKLFTDDDLVANPAPVSPAETDDASTPAPSHPGRMPRRVAPL